MIKRTSGRKWWKHSFPWINDSAADRLWHLPYLLLHLFVLSRFIKEPRYVTRRTGLTCGETSEAGWVERWAAWPDQASRDGTASSSVPGSGCVCTPDLWTRGNLCLCSGRDRGGGKRGTRGTLLEMLADPSKHTANTATKLSNTKLKVQTRPAHTGPWSAGG